MSVFVAKVKNVLSPDTLVLIPSKSTQIPVPERVLSLGHVRGTSSFEAKEHIRNLLIGKSVKVNVEHKSASGREFGDISTPIFDSLIEYGLSKGLYKLRDNVDEDLDLKSLEDKARTENLGVWGAYQASDPLEVALDESTISKSQNTPITTIVEKVINGDRVIARIILNKKEHVVTPLLLAGIKSPRTDDTTNQSANVIKVAHQAKQFVEEKLMTTTAQIKVSIIGTSQSGLPIGLLIHPSGNNIHEKLLEYGYAEVVDWQSSLVGSAMMGKFRKAEQNAKALAKGLFAGSSTAASKSLPVGASGASSKVSIKTLRPGSKFDATIAKVITADSLLLRLPSDEELTVQLASVRAPRQNDAALSANSADRIALVNSAREFVRNLAIGKQVSIVIDGCRAANPEFGIEERFVVTATLPGNKDLSETIISNGWATVIKHNKATANERSLNWDRLVEIEQEQQKAGKKGIYYTGDKSKMASVSSRIVDASENLAKAKTFFSGLKKKGRIGGYHVEYISSVNRVKLFNPREGLKLTLILGGLTNSKNDMSDMGLKYMNKKFLQRNVEFEIYDQDKIGGFIGNLFANQKSLEPIQVVLLEQGLSSIHDIAITSNSFADEFIKAEESAKSSKKGIWASYDPVKEQQEQEANSAKLQNLTLESKKPEFFDIEATYVDDFGVISFQLIDASTRSKFENFKADFQRFHSQNTSATSSSVDLPYNLVNKPKNGEIVSAKVNKEGFWSRVKVINFDKSENKFDVKDIDYGTEYLLPLSNLRLLPQQYNIRSVAPFAHTCTLQNIRLPPTKPTDYLTDALYALEDLCYDKKLVISAIVNGKNGVEYTGVLYDSEKSVQDPSYTINKELVKQGWGLVDKKAVGPATKDYDEELLTAQQSARSNHLGCWEFGDITFDDDLE